MRLKATKTWFFIVNNLLIIFFILYLFSCARTLVKHAINNSVIVFIVSCLVSSFLLFLVYQIRNGKHFFETLNKYSKHLNTKLEISTKSIRIIMLLIFFIPFLIRLALVFIFQIPILGDPGVYIDISKEIVSNGIVVRNAEYSSNFPHLFWFGFFLVPASLFSSFGDWVYQAYMSLILSFNSLLIYRICKYVSKSKLTAIKIALIYSYLPSQLFCGLAVTHEVMFTFFLLSAVAVWCKKKSFLSWIVLSFLLAISRLINSVGIICVIALIFCLVFSWGSFKRVSNRVFALLIFIVIMIFVSVSADAIQKAMTAGNVVLRQSCVEWQLFIGANTNTNGRWNANDVEIFSQINDSAKSVSEVKIAYRNLVLDRWNNLLESPLKLLSLLCTKFCSDWSGTQYSIELALAYTHSRLLSMLLKAIMIINHLMYMSLIAFAMPDMIKNRKQLESDIILFMKTTILGVVCMLLFTETMNKYTITMLGFIIVLLGYYSFRNILKQFRIEKNNSVHFSV